MRRHTALPRILVLLAALPACTGAPDDPCVLRPHGGGPTAWEQVEAEYEADPVGTAYTLGQVIGTVAIIVLTIASPAR